MKSFFITLTQLTLTIMLFLTILNNVFDFAGIFILWIVLHFIAANLYSKFCAVWSPFGFIESIFVAQTPYCIAMRWIIYNGGNTINSMWVSIGLWITGKIFKNIRNKNIVDSE